LNFPLIAEGEFRLGAETVIDLPALCRQGELTDVLTERRYDGTRHLDAAALMHGCPLALLTTIRDTVGSEPW